MRGVPEPDLSVEAPAPCSPAPCSDVDAVDVLAGVLRAEEPDDGTLHQHEGGNHQEGGGPGAGTLVHPDGDERPEHVTDQEGDRPGEAVADAADAGRVHPRGVGGRGTPDAEAADAPQQPATPELELGVADDPRRREASAPDPQPPTA